VDALCDLRRAARFVVDHPAYAARTALMAIGSGGWDDGLMDLFGVPRDILPEITDCAGDLGKTLPEHFGGEIRISGMAGDQQAATIGQGCFAVGQTKATFGTGAFVLTQTGTTLRQSRHRLLSTILYQFIRAKKCHSDLIAATRRLLIPRDVFDRLGTVSATRHRLANIGINVETTTAGRLPHTVIIRTDLDTTRFDHKQVEISAIGPSQRDIDEFSLCHCATF
jgi:sugar (pentulose or hexulose) kinase